MLVFWQARIDGFNTPHMLSFLQIRNFAIVETLDLEFIGGFTAITGETGAGKSILVDALGLLKGNRADTAAIRAGAGKAELSAEFQLAKNSKALAWLKNAELDDGAGCLLRRLISENGRSRAWVNGTAVTLQQLSELGDLLIEIHGQNEHIRLVHSKEQFRLLDDHGAHNKKLETVERGYQEWKKLELEKQLLLDESPLDAGDSELLQYQVRELDDAMLPPGKLQALETEHRRLARGSELMAALEFARRSLESDKTGIGDTLNAAIDRLQEYASLDPLIDEAMKLLNEAAINCDEARNSIQGAISGMDLSPERLLEVENKLSMQHDLARKHRVQPEQLGEVLNKLKERLERAGSLDKRLSAIDPKLDQALQSYRKKAQALHQVRHSRAAILSKAVSSLMQELGMQGGRFEFEVQYDGSASPTSGGNDRLELRVSANPGTPPGPLRKVASGGELSRISLAIKVASKCGDPAQTQVFDEVDAGIGGRHGKCRRRSAEKSFCRWTSPLRHSPCPGRRLRRSPVPGA